MPVSTCEPKLTSSLAQSQLSVFHSRARKLHPPFQRGLTQEKPSPKPYQAPHPLTLDGEEVGEAAGAAVASVGAVVALDLAAASAGAAVAGVGAEATAGGAVEAGAEDGGGRLGLDLASAWLAPIPTMGMGVIPPGIMAVAITAAAAAAERPILATAADDLFGEPATVGSFVKGGYLLRAVRG